MTTPSGLKGPAADAYGPFQTDPDPPPVPGSIQTGKLDPSLYQMIRASVYTDEGGLREMFGANPFTPPDSPWTVTNSGGGTVNVAGGTCTITGGAVPGGLTYISIPIDFLPMLFNFDLDEVAGRLSVGNTQDFFFGMFSDPDVLAAIAAGEFVEDSWLGTGGNTSGTFRSGAGGFLQTTTHTITGRTTQGWRTIGIDGDNTFIRDNSVNIPTTTTRATHSTKMPNLQTELYLCIGFRNGATPIPWSVDIDAIFAKNTNRLVVNTGFLAMSIRQTTKDGRLIVAPTQAPDGWRTFITGASDNPSDPVSKNGSGAPIRVTLAGPGDDGVDIPLAAPVFLHNGSLQRSGLWSIEDSFSLSARIPATSFDQDGKKDVFFVPIGGGAGFWLPAEPGQGTHDFDQAKAIPVMASPSLPQAASWGVDEETSDVLPNFGVTGPVMLINFPVESFFARNIPMGADFYSDADQSEWVSQKWVMRLQVHKVSLGAGSVAGMLFTYRRSTS